MTTGKITVDKTCKKWLGKMTKGKMTVDKITVGKMTIGNAVGKMTADEMTFCAIEFWTKCGILGRN